MMEDRKAFPYRSVFSGKFLFSAFILCFAATGLRPLLGYLENYYSKEVIAINRPLKEFDFSSLPSYSEGWTRTNMPVKDDIETDEYLLTEFQREERGKIPPKIILFVTYYSDPASKVPHTPDVCYRQIGSIIDKIENVEIDVPNLSSGDKQLKARLLMIRQAGDVRAVIIYSFCAEGLLRCAREQTRFALGMPGNKYTYFSKVEVVASFSQDSDLDVTIAECKRLYAEAMVELLSEHFPTREQLKRR